MDVFLFPFGPFFRHVSSKSGHWGLGMNRKGIPFEESPSSSKTGHGHWPFTPTSWSPSGSLLRLPAKRKGHCPALCGDGPRMKKTNTKQKTRKKKQRPAAEAFRRSFRRFSLEASRSCRELPPCGWPSTSPWRPRWRWASGCSRPEARGSRNWRCGGRGFSSKWCTSLLLFFWGRVPLKRTTEKKSGTLILSSQIWRTQEARGGSIGFGSVRESVEGAKALQIRERCPLLTS